MNQAYGRYGEYGSYGDLGDSASMAADAIAIAKGLFAPKSSYELRGQLAAARSRGASMSTINDLQGRLDAALDSEGRADTWRILGQVALIGVIGLTLAGSFAIVNRAVKKQ